MNRRAITIIVASHLLVIFAGVMLARQEAGAAARVADSPESKAKAEQSEMAVSTAQRSARTYRPSKEWHGSEFARAWKAMPGAKLSTGDRINAQRELLKKWAEVDLTAAIEAALDEAWDSDGGGYYDPSGPLLDVFSTAFAKNPQEGWDLLVGKQFGVATGMLRNVWIKAVGDKDTQFLAKHIGEISWRDRQLALNVCKNAVSASMHGGLGDALFKILARMPEEVVTTDQLVVFATLPDGRVADPDTMKEDILRLGNSDERMAKVKAVVFGQAISIHSPEEIAIEIQGMSKAVAEEVLWAAFKGGTGAESVLGTMNLLIDQGAWAKVEKADTSQLLQILSRNGNSEVVADWATSMPVRKETTELFHRSVDTYLRDHMDSSREWISGISDKTWRDRAYAEYSQQALNAHNDPAASRWALDQIGDPDFKAEATSWRSKWETRMGWTGK